MPNIANIENPTEDQEQEAFVPWLRLKGYPHFRVPNDLAVVVPDVWYGYGDNVPREDLSSYTNTYANRLVFIEMKRKK